jgi:hypothetical protein
MKLFRTISALSLALLVLMSSTSFIVGMHFCMGEVQDVAIFTKADGCAMEKLPPCHRHTSKPCCDDETLVHDGDVLKLSEQLTLFVQIPVEVEAPFTLYSEIIPSVSNSREYYLNYDPPLLDDDRTIKHRVFLI